MKICLINNLYEPYCRGGADRIVKMSAQGFCEQGDEVFVVTTEPKWGRRAKKLPNVYYLPSLFWYLNKIPYCLRLFWHIFSQFNLVNFYKVKKILKKESPDLVITHNLIGISFLLPRLIKKLNIRLVHTLHDAQLLHPAGVIFFHKEKKINTFSAKLYQTINKYLFAKLDVVVSPSNWIIEQHVKRGFFKDVKKEIILNPLARQKSGTTGEKKYDFIFIGELERHKGVDIIIKAFSRMDVGASLAVVGDGGQREFVEKIKNVKYFGWLENEKAMKVLSQSRCLLLASRCYENSPTVFFEAANLGIATIGADLGGIKELIDRIGGIKFSPENVEDLMQKLIWATKNSEQIKKIGEIARARMISCFGPGEYAKTIKTL